MCVSNASPLSLWMVMMVLWFLIKIDLHTFTVLMMILMLRTVCFWSTCPSGVRNTQRLWCNFHWIAIVSPRCFVCDSLANMRWCKTSYIIWALMTMIIMALTSCFWTRNSTDHHVEAVMQCSLNFLFLVTNLYVCMNMIVSCMFICARIAFVCTVWLC